MECKNLFLINSELLFQQNIFRLAAAAAAAPVDVSRLNLKVGKIIDIKRHPDADGLFMETGNYVKQNPFLSLSLC